MNIRPETRELFKKIFKVLAPPPNMTLSEWADNTATVPDAPPPPEKDNGIYPPTLKAS